MTVDQLIEILTEYRDQHGPDAEVRLMTQENWPFENAVARVTSGAELNAPGEEGDDQDVADDTIVYIVEGSQLGYGSKRAWETCRDC